MTEEKRPRHYDEEDLLTADQLQEIEEKFDPELRFRDLLRPVAILAGALLFLLSCYHYYTAGFGIPQAVVHRGLHMAVTLFVVFLSFSAWGKGEIARGPLSFLGLPLGDWALAFAGAITSLYVPYIYDVLAFRGEFLHIYTAPERVVSDQPVTLLRGTDRLQADTLNYVGDERVANFKGRVKVRMEPR